MFSICLLVASCCALGCKESEPAIETEEKLTNPDTKTEIVSEPEGALVFIDEELMGVTPLVILKEISSGDLRL